MEAVHDGNLSGGNVGNHLGDEERIELRSVFLVCPVVFHFVLEGLDTADTHAIDYADAVLVFCLQVHAAVVDSLLGSDDGQLRIAVHLASLFTVNPFVDIQTFHFASEMSLAFRSVEQCDRCSTTLAGHQVFPAFFGIQSNRSNGTKTCYNNSF